MTAAASWCCSAENIEQNFVAADEQDAAFDREGGFFGGEIGHVPFVISVRAVKSEDQPNGDR